MLTSNIEKQDKLIQKASWLANKIRSNRMSFKETNDSNAIALCETMMSVPVKCLQTAKQFLDTQDIYNAELWIEQARESYPIKIFWPENLK